MNALEIRNAANEYLTVPVAELTESTTNPRKAFDEERLNELAASIRNHGVLSPLVVRHVNGHFEIVAGARRYRAAQRAGLAELPVRVLALTDAEAQELQIIENVQRSDVHPFEEAQGFRALLDREGGSYTIEKIAAAIAKPATYVARRLKLLDLIEPAAQAFMARHIGLEHALLIAKLTPDMQEQALAHCFDGYFAGSEAERSLVPASRFQEWIAHNVYLSLKSVPFSKDDETLVPEAGSCANCPKRTGFNTLLFPEVRENLCSDASCFHRKLDAHIAQRKEKMPNLVLISEHYALNEETPILPRRNYVEVIARRAKRGNAARPEQRLCNHLVPDIHADGMDKDASDWELAQKARALYKKADAAALAVLLFEAILLGCAGSATAERNDDPLVEAAALYKIQMNALRAAVAKDEIAKTRKKPAKPKPGHSRP